MVGPVSGEERASFARKLKAGLTLVVGLSGALVAVQAGAPARSALAAGVVGLVVGGFLARFVLPDGDEH